MSDPYTIKRVERPSFTRRLRSQGKPKLWIEHMCDNGTNTERGSGALTPCPRHGNEGSMRGQSISERFWSKVNRRGGDECWEWMGSRLPTGYGQFLVGSRTNGSRGTQRAHRLAYEMAIGPIPVGQYILHSCDNPPCCNPAHLSAGSQFDNMQDMARKGRTGTRSGVEHWTRSKPERLSRGSSHPDAKLTETEVAEIIALHEGGATQVALAQRFKMGRSSIGRIVRRQAWRHVK